MKASVTENELLNTFRWARTTENELLSTFRGKRALPSTSYWADSEESEHYRARATEHIQIKARLPSTSYWAHSDESERYRARATEAFIWKTFKTGNSIPDSEHSTLNVIEESDWVRLNINTLYTVVHLELRDSSFIMLNLRQPRSQTTPHRILTTNQNYKIIYHSSQLITYHATSSAHNPPPSPSLTTYHHYPHPITTHHNH